MAVPARICGFEVNVIISVDGRHRQHKQHQKTPPLIISKRYTLHSSPPSSTHSFVEGESYDDEFDEVAALGGDPFFLGTDDDEQFLTSSTATTDDNLFLWDGEVVEDAHLDFVDRVPLSKQVEDKTANHRPSFPRNRDDDDSSDNDSSQSMPATGNEPAHQTKAPSWDNTIQELSENQNHLIKTSAGWEWDGTVDEDAHLQDEFFDDDDGNNIVTSFAMPSSSLLSTFANMPNSVNEAVQKVEETKKIKKAEIDNTSDAKWEWDGVVNEDAHLEDDVYGDDDDEMMFPSSLLSSMATTVQDIENLPTRLTQRYSSGSNTSSNNSHNDAHNEDEDEYTQGMNDTHNNSRWPSWNGRRPVLSGRLRWWWF